MIEWTSICKANAQYMATGECFHDERNRDRERTKDTEDPSMDVYCSMHSNRVAELWLYYDRDGTCSEIDRMDMALLRKLAENRFYHCGQHTDEPASKQNGTNHDENKESEGFYRCCFGCSYCFAFDS